MAKVMVDIPGYGQVEATNAATESTLRDILKALKKGGTGSGGSTGSGAQAGATQQATKATNTFAKKIGETSTVVDDFGNAVGRAASSITGMLGSAISGITGVAGDLIAGFVNSSGRLEELGNALPIPGLGALGKLLDDTVDGFRSAAGAGASFGNDMFGLTRAAADAGMTVDMMSEAIANNSNVMAQLGASTTEGVKRFGELTKGLRTSRLGDSLMNMGYSIEDINEGFLNYTDQMARQGRLQGMSDAQLQQGTALYLEELDKLAKVTGVQREELERQRDAAMNDARVRMMSNKLEGQERENFLNNIAQLNTISPTLAETFVDLADGNAKSAAAQRLLATDVGAQAQQLAADMASGAVGSAEFNNRLAALGPGLDNFFSQMDAAQLDALKDLDPELYALAEAAGTLNRLQVKSAEDIAKEQTARDKLTDVTTSSQQAFLDLKGKITNTFLDSPLFETLSDGLASIIEPAEGASGLFEQIKPKLDEFLNWINGWVEQFMADPVGTFNEIKENIKESLKNGVGDLFSSFLPSLDTVLVGAVAGIGALILAPVAAPFIAIAASIGAMFGYDKVKEWLSEGWNAITNTFSGIGEWWDGVSLDKVFSDAWTGLTEWGKGMFDFDFELPDFSDYLPTWLGGEGKPIGDLFGSSTDVPPSASASVEDLEKVNPDNVEFNSNVNPASSQSSDPIMTDTLNSTMQRMIALLEESNRLTRRTNSAIGAAGNLQG